MEKFKGKYRISSARLQSWDYNSNALYFITICTQNLNCFFGDVLNGKMELSEIGKLAEKYWFEIPKHFPFVKLDAFVVMPNHIHGIVEIAKTNNEQNNDECNVNTKNVETQNIETQNIETQNIETQNIETQNIETQNIASLPSVTTTINKFGPQSQNLASIVRGYKIGVTKDAKIINSKWKWQPRFYDHIIRNDKSYNNIKQYIIHNPKNWVKDKLNQTNTD